MDTENSLIRTLRLQLGMTQEEFAHALSVTVSTVNRWENSHAQPSRLARKAIKELARRNKTGAAGRSGRAPDVEA